MAKFGVSPWATADWGGPPLTLTPSGYERGAGSAPLEARKYRPTKRRTLLDMQLQIRNKIAAEQLKQMRQRALDRKRDYMDEQRYRRLEPYRQQKRSPGQITQDKIWNERLKKLREEAANRAAVVRGVGPNAIGNLGAYKAGRVAARGLFTGDTTGQASFDPYGGDPGISATPRNEGRDLIAAQVARSPYSVQQGAPSGPDQPIPPWMQGMMRPQIDYSRVSGRLPKREKGGTVPKTGPYELHKGEIVVSADQVDEPLLHALKTDKLQKMGSGQMNGKGTGPGRSLAGGSYRGGTMKGYKKGTLGSYQKGFGPASDLIDDYWKQYILDEDLSNLPGARPESGMTVPPRRGMPPADWERFLGGERPPVGGAPRGGAMVPSRGGGMTPGRGGGAMSVLEGGMDLPPSSGDLLRAPPGAGGGGDVPNVESMWDKWRVTGTRSPGGKGARSLGPGARAAGPGVNDALAKVAKRTKIPAKSLRGLGWRGLIAVAGAAGAAGIARALFGGDGEAEADVIPGRPPGQPPEEALLGGGPEEMTPEEMTPEDILGLEEPMGDPLHGVLPSMGVPPRGDKFDEWTQQYQAQQEAEQQRSMRDMALLARGAPRPEAGAAPEGPEGDALTVPSMSDEEFERSERKAKYVRDKMETERDKETAVKNNIQADRLDRYLAGNASAMDQKQWQQMTQQVARLRKSAETIDTRMEDRKKIETVLASDADKAIAEYRKAVDVAALEEGGKMAREQREEMQTIVSDLDDKYDAYSVKFSEGKITGDAGEKAAMEKMAKLAKAKADASDSPMSLPIARIIVEWDLGIIDDQGMQDDLDALDDAASRRILDELR